MKIKYSYILILFIVFKLYSYEYTSFQKQYLYLPQSRFISSNFISHFKDGKPFSPSNVFNSNPAYASMFTTISIGTELSYGSVIDDAINIHSELNRTNLYMPQSIGALIPINKFVLGLGFYRKYSTSFSYVGYLPATHRDKDRRSFWDLDINAIAILSSYASKSPFNSNHNISIGLQIEDNFLSYSGYGDGFTEKLNTEKFNWIIGFQYYKEKSFLIGISYAHVMDLSSKAKFKGDEQIYPNPDFEFSLDYKWPRKITINSNVKIFNSIDLNTNYSLMLWKDVYSKYHNQSEYFLSLGSSITNSLSASLGGYYTYFLSSREDENPTYPYDLGKVETEFYSLFLMADIGYSFSNYRLKLAIFDNHLFSSDNWKQTNIILSFAYSF